MFSVVGTRTTCKVEYTNARKPAHGKERSQHLDLNLFSPKCQPSLGECHPGGVVPSGRGVGEAIQRGMVASSGGGVVPWHYKKLHHGTPLHEQNESQTGDHTVVILDNKPIGNVL